ncbi:MAG: galactonate dehydratase [Phycisphaeraceae bacterium]|nr:galactonate dehydratase [Phycisphaeraceae bacterium]
MKISRIDQFFPRHRIRLVRITTDTGLVGWGETTLEGRHRSTHAAVDEIADYLVGQDPRRIEHHWQHLYRYPFYRGGSVRMSALSGIDQALWDILGKHHGVPAHALLGGAVRDRIRVYAHWGIADLSDETQAAARERLDMLQRTGGYTAFKSGPPGPWRAHEPPSVIDQWVKCAYLMREWVGPEVELAFDFHGKMAPALAIEICHELKSMRPMFVEEPVPQENIDALKLVSDHVTFPIATGERLMSRWEYREVFEKQAVAFIQPDASHAGGISELRRIAQMAEVYSMHVLPHCAIGPVALAACMQVDAVTPNFLCQEQVDAALGNGLLTEDWKVTDGYIGLPTRPGLGFEIDEAAAQGRVESGEELGGVFRYEDGSVADW